MIKLEGHSVVLYGKSFYFFGGYDLSRKCATNDVYRVDLTDLERGLRSNGVGGPAAPPSTGGDIGKFNTRASQVYAEVPMIPLHTTGPVPSPRAFHSTCLRGPHLVVWGGTVDTAANEEHSTQASVFSMSPNRSPPSDPPSKSSRSSVTMELYGLNLETLVWTEYRVASVAPQVKRQAIPQPRCHGTMISTEESMLLYGGYPSVVQHGETEAAVAENEWSVFSVAADGQCEAHEPAGAAPALWGHSMVHAHRCLVVFGGVDVVSSEEVRSLCIYHVDEQRWRWAEFPEGPCPRALHAAAIDYASGEMLVFGGFTSFIEDAATMSSSPGDAPDSGSLAVQLGDVWSFSLETGLWEQLWPTTEKVSGAPQGASSMVATPKGRSGHVVICHDRRLYSFGGLIDDQRCQSDDRSIPEGTKPSSWLTSSTSPAAPRTAGVGADVGGSGTIAIFDVLTRTWTMKQLVVSKQSPSAMAAGTSPQAKFVSGSWSPTAATKAPVDSDAARSKRESIIDRYLNPVQPLPSPAPSGGSPVVRKGPDYRVADSFSRIRTVATRHSPDGDGKRSKDGIVEGFSSFFGSTPPRSSDLLDASPDNFRADLVATTMRLVRDEEQQRRAQSQGVPPSSSLFRPAQETQHASPSSVSRASRASPSALPYSDSPSHVASVSPLQSQKEWISEYRRQLSERQAAVNSVGSVVSAISQAQNEADHRWTQAENERRARLLMRYMQAQPGASDDASYYGYRTPPQRSTANAGALQDDESPNVAVHIPSPTLDARFVVRPSQQLPPSATPHAGSAASMSVLRSASSDRLAHQSHTSLDRIVLDADESAPVDTDTTAAPHHPLWPGPWGRSSR